MARKAIGVSAVRWIEGIWGGREVCGEGVAGDDRAVPWIEGEGKCFVRKAAPQEGAPDDARSRWIEASHEDVLDCRCAIDRTPRWWWGTPERSLIRRQRCSPDGAVARPIVISVPDPPRNVLQDGIPVSGSRIVRKQSSPPLCPVSKLPGVTGKFDEDVLPQRTRLRPGPMADPRRAIV